MGGANLRAERRSDKVGDPDRPLNRDLAGALHEVSNALTVMLGWLERARGSSTGIADAERALDVAISRARLARTIARRAIGGELPPEPPRSVVELVTDAIVALEPEAKRARVRLESDLASELELLSIEGSSEILQILTNLLLNALAFSPRGATVRLEAVHDAGADHVVFAVVDEGPGIPVSRHPDLFAAGVSTREGGAGIGLKHAWALAREAGGALSLIDVPKGARFELRWPRILGEGFESSPASARGAALSGVRVLVVEDDQAVVDLLDAALTARGAEVVSVRGRAGLADALDGGRFEAALVDISPIEDDVEGALRALREANPEARLVLMSGSAVVLPSVPTEWFAVWVRKPFEISEIVRALSGKRGAE